MATDNRPHMSSPNPPPMMYLTVLVPSISSVPMNVVPPTNDTYALFQVTDAPDSKPLGVTAFWNYGFALMYNGLADRMFLTCAYGTDWKGLYEPYWTYDPEFGENYWMPNGAGSKTADWVSGQPFTMTNLGLTPRTTIGMVGTNIVVGEVGDPGFELVYFVFTFSGPSPDVRGRVPNSRAPGPPRTLGAFDRVSRLPDTSAGHGVPHGAASAPDCTHVASTSGGSLYFCPN